MMRSRLAGWLVLLSDEKLKDGAQYDGNKLFFNFASVHERAPSTAMPYGGVTTPSLIREEAIRLLDLMFEAHDILDVAQLLKLAAESGR